MCVGLSSNKTLLTKTNSNLYLALMPWLLSLCSRTSNGPWPKRTGITCVQCTRSRPTQTCWIKICVPAPSPVMYGKDPAAWPGFSPHPQERRDEVLYTRKMRCGGIMWFNCWVWNWSPRSKHSKNGILSTHFKEPTLAPAPWLWVGP